ncbi:MAG: hypothetical protein WAK67_18615 [Xanthobacteraceae bacterium]
MPRHSIEAESNEIKSVSLAKAAEALLKAERIVCWKADSHLDVGMSEFFTKQMQLGLVGYFYDQLIADSGYAPVV